MLYHLVYPLSKYINSLNLFRYITLRTAIAITISLIIFLVFGKKFISYIKEKSNIVIRKLTPDGHQKKIGTPSMGGILIILATLISTLFTGNLTNPNIILSMVTLIGFGALGFFDDYVKDFKGDGRGISSKTKLLFQIGLASLIAFYIYKLNPNDYYFIYHPDPNNLNIFNKLPIDKLQLLFPFFTRFTVENGILSIPYSINLGWLYVPFATIVIVSFSNAVNITDGLDGLAGGLTLFVLLGFMGITYLSGHIGVAEYLKIPFIDKIGELTVFTGALAGATLGFLWFNSHPASIFMGDTGSLSLGGIIAVISLLLKSEILLVLIGGVFVLEIVSVVLQVGSYKLRKKRIFKMAPIHHHFELNGLHENKIITRLWSVGAILALLGLASLKIH